MRDPTDAALDRDHLEAREAVEKSRVNELRHELGRVSYRTAHFCQSDLAPERCRGLLERAFRLTLAGLAQTAVDVDGHLLFFCHFPDRVALGGQVRLPRWKGRDDAPPVA